MPPVPPSVTPLVNSHSPMFSVLASAKITRHTTRRQTKLSHNTLFFQIPSVSSEKLTLPRLTRFVMSRHCCHGHSLLLSSYLCKIKRKENSSCSACAHHLQTLTHLSGLSRIRASPTRHLRNHFFQSLIQTLGYVPTVGSPQCSSATLSPIKAG